jgi:hypothetical protein
MLEEGSLCDRVMDSERDMWVDLGSYCCGKRGVWITFMSDRMMVSILGTSLRHLWTVF